MKKKILLVVMVSMLFAGVVSAASIWGTYKGNQIIRITSNGVALKTPDVPAISYNGRTMVPISMLGQLGVGYSWDAKNQTVDVRTNNSSQSTNAAVVKNYVSYADYFHNLETLGDMIVGLNNYYSIAFNYVVTNNAQSSAVLSDANKSLNEIIDTYNQLNNQSPNYVDSNIKTILDGYYNSLENYKKADTALNAYHSNKSSESFGTFNTNNNSAFKLASTARFSSSARYTFYINAALNTK